MILEWSSSHNVTRTSHATAGVERGWFFDDPPMTRRERKPTRQRAVAKNLPSLTFFVTITTSLIAITTITATLLANIATLNDTTTTIVNRTNPRITFHMQGMFLELQYTTRVEFA